MLFKQFISEQRQSKIDQEELAWYEQWLWPTIGAVFQLRDEYELVETLFPFASAA